MKTTIAKGIAAIVLAASLGSCSFKMGADGSKEATLDVSASQAAAAALQIIAEK